MKMKMTSTLIVGLLLVANQVLGYPSQERLMPDGAPVPEDATAPHEDSVAAASETVGDEYDDSDMYMEPDGAEAGLGDQASAAAHHVADEEAVAIVDETLPGVFEKIEDHARAIAEKPLANRREFADKSLQSDSQNFFPTFARLFSNHRLPFEEQQQQQHYRPNRFLGYFQRERDGFATAASSDEPHPLLGSGNFGVIRGGTYYSDDKENDEYTAGESLYNPYYDGSNDGGTQNYYGNPAPQPVEGGDFFANFRDFADITATPKPSYSHLSIVYANKNGKGERITEPRNIIETLRMLEEESETATTEVPQKKLSSGKRKLLKLKKYEDDKTRKSRMTTEPLLALS